jgi:hypothetical protein
MGISRSATVVCGYFVATMKMTPQEALAAVKAKRGIVCPNLGFRIQLEEYARVVQDGGGKGRIRWTRQGLCKTDGARVVHCRLDLDLGGR